MDLRYTLDFVYRVRGATAHREPWDDAIARVTTTPRRSAQWRARLINAAWSDDQLERLWAAVLRDAIEALRGWHLDSRGGQALHQNADALWHETTAWIAAPSRDPLGTFGSICALLELDDDVVRRDLVALAHDAPVAPKHVARVVTPVAPPRRARAYRAA